MGRIEKIDKIRHELIDLRMLIDYGLFRFNFDKDFVLSTGPNTTQELLTTMDDEVMQYLDSLGAMLKRKYDAKLKDLQDQLDILDAD